MLWSVRVNLAYKTISVFNQMVWELQVPYFGFDAVLVHVQDRPRPQI